MKRKLQIFSVWLDHLLKRNCASVFSSFLGLYFFGHAAICKSRVYSLLCQSSFFSQNHPTKFFLPCGSCCRDLGGPMSWTPWPQPRCNGLKIQLYSVGWPGKVLTRQPTPQPRLLLSTPKIASLQPSSLEQWMLSISPAHLVEFLAALLHGWTTRAIVFFCKTSK